MFFLFLFPICKKDSYCYFGLNLCGGETVKIQHKTKVPKTCLCVPGMLLELPAPVLSQMLQDEATLTAALEKALRALQLAQESRYSRGLPDLISFHHLSIV